MEKRNELVHDGKALLGIVRAATRHVFNREGLEEESVDVSVNEFFNTAQYVVKYYGKFFEEDREMAVAGLTKCIGEVEKSGYGVVVSMDYGKTSGAIGNDGYLAIVHVLKNE